MQLLTLMLLGLLPLLAACQAMPESKTVCYYEYWAHYRESRGQMEPSDIGKRESFLRQFHSVERFLLAIDSSLCTHLVYAFLDINKDTHELMLPDPELMNDKREYIHPFVMFDLV